MDKQQQKKAKAREIDLVIIGCALQGQSQSCDEAELVHLAIEYATEFRCPYQLSAVHMRSLETEAEREIARKLEANVNNVIRHTMRREMAGLSRLVMQRLTDQPKPIPRELVRTCECSAIRRSPRCKLSPQFCKYTPQMKTVTRRKTRSNTRSPKTSKTRSPKTKSA